MANNTTRDNAPAYLAAYEQRRIQLEGARAEAAAGVGRGIPGVSPGGIDPNRETEPLFVARARDRQTRVALAELTRDDGPPGNRTEQYARDMVAPRELQYPEEFRQRHSTMVDVRLIRHGQTQGYVADGALTALGQWQAHRKGQDLAKGLKEGMTVKFPHAPTARARETALGVRQGIETALAKYGIGDVTLEDPIPNNDFNNFQVWAGGKEMDVTAAFIQFANIREKLLATGDRPGWIVEMDRFYRIENAGGDPITQWLTMPLQYFESPVLVVRRHWRGIVNLVRESTPNTKIYMCGHSGPIRAMATSAVGHDAGEPNNTEDVRIKVYDDYKNAVLTYRGRGLEIQIPTNVTPSWFTH
jgi:broad specificity phosphatase PhoE